MVTFLSQCDTDHNNVQHNGTSTLSVLMSKNQTWQNTNSLINLFGWYIYKQQSMMGRSLFWPMLWTSLHSTVHPSECIDIDMNLVIILWVTKPHIVDTWVTSKFYSYIYINRNKNHNIWNNVTTLPTSLTTLGHSSLPSPHNKSIINNHPLKIIQIHKTSVTNQDLAVLHSQIWISYFGSTFWLRNSSLRHQEYIILLYFIEPTTLIISISMSQIQN